MRNRKIEKRISTYIFLKVTASFAVSLRLLFLPLVLSYKITDFHMNLVSSSKSLSPKSPAI